METKPSWFLVAALASEVAEARSGTPISSAPRSVSLCPLRIREMDKPSNCWLGTWSPT